MAPSAIVVKGKISEEEEKELSDIITKTTSLAVDKDKPISEYNASEKKELVKRMVREGTKYVERENTEEKPDGETKRLYDILSTSRNQAVTYAKKIPRRQVPTGMAIIRMNVDGNRHLSELIVKYMEKEFRKNNNRDIRSTDVFYFTDHTITAVFPITKTTGLSFVKMMEVELTTSLHKLGYAFFDSPIKVAIATTYEEGIDDKKVRQMSERIKRHALVYEMILKSTRGLYKRA